MRFVYFIFLFVGLKISNGDESEKYGLLRQKCERSPSNSECLQLKSKFSELIKKCQKIKTQEQFTICQQVKIKLCAVFPSACGQASTKTLLSTTQKTTTTTKLIKTTKKTAIIQALTTKTATPAITAKGVIDKNDTMTNEEFVKVPVNPDELRVRGEYCVRNGKEKKCQELLNNLKNTYSSCSKKKPTTEPTKPEQLDCHSFQSHLCKAFPKFPPCIKKTQN